MELAVSMAQVSAFCQAVLSKIIPFDFWGSGDVQMHNRQVFLKNVDRFIKLRRFEVISLHEVMQGLKVSNSSTYLVTLTFWTGNCVDFARSLISIGSALLGWQESKNAAIPISASEWRFLPSLSIMCSIPS